MTAVNPVAYRSEHLSPFLGWEEDAGRLPGPQDEPEDALLVQLLQAPTAVVDRVLDPARAQSTVLASLGIIAGASGLAALIMLSGWEDAPRLRLVDAGLVALGMLGALAASIVPVWGLGVLRTVRMPFTQLVGLLTTSVAASSLLLVALAAAPAVLWRLDPEWAGPLAVVGAFIVAAFGCILRFRSQLLLVASRTLGEQADNSPADLSRVKTFAHDAMLVLAFTNILAGWAWLAQG